MDSTAPSRIVGRYALFEPIASGGMASVHLGRLMGPVGFSRTVAIKRLHENFAKDPEFVAMFLDEARLVARIRHPNVVPTLDVVALEQELLLVMEYVVGVPLGVLITNSHKNGNLPAVPIVADVMINLLNGLHAAHEATNEEGQPLNIVHRDVSPHNVLVGADGITRVLDFGVAKAVGRMHQTREGEVKGKLRYMAPEHLTSVGVSRSSDIFSASVVFWEAVTGKRLFSGDHDAQVMYNVLHGVVPAPSRLRRDVPPELDRIILRGLRREPENRFGSAKEMANAIEGAVSPVTRSAVSAWVASTAGDYVENRQRSMARVESAVTPLRRPSAPPPKALRSFGQSSPSGEFTTPTSAGSLAQSLSPEPLPSARPRARILGFAAATVLLAVVLIWFLPKAEQPVLSAAAGSQVVTPQAATNEGSTEKPLTAAVEVTARAEVSAQPAIVATAPSVEAAGSGVVVAAATASPPAERKRTRSRKRAAAPKKKSSDIYRRD